MRKLVYAINLTLDGCCDHTKGSGTDEVLDYHMRLLKDTDVLLYGRKTYQLMVPFWPEVAKSNSGTTKAMNDFAHTFDAVNRIVVCSRSLEVTEARTKIIRTNLKDEVLRLKEEPGKNILMGGVDIPSQLIQLGLVDEYHFVIHPVVVGEGRRLFSDVNLAEKLQLKLIESKVFSSGGIALRYTKPF